MPERPSRRTEHHRTEEVNNSRHDCFGLEAHAFQRLLIAKSTGVADVIRSHDSLGRIVPVYLTRSQERKGKRWK